MRLLSLRAALLASSLSLAPSFGHARESLSLLRPGAFLGMSGVQLALVVAGLVLLFTMLSAMYAFIFRQVCRRVAKGPHEFGILRGTIFFAVVPLLVSMATGLLNALFRFMAPQGATAVSVTLAVTVLSTAVLARKFLLKPAPGTLTYLRTIVITAVTFAIGGGISQLAKVLLA